MEQLNERYLLLANSILVTIYRIVYFEKAALRIFYSNDKKDSQYQNYNIY